MKKLMMILLMLGFCHSAFGLNAVEVYNARHEFWKITYYCSCEKCCGKWADGHFASGKKVYKGGVAINWLPFGTKVRVGTQYYTVEDRGAKSIFGTKTNHKHAMDIWVGDHQKALNLGVKYKKVVILRPEYGETYEN